MGTIEERFAAIGADEDLSTEEFEQYMKEFVPRFFAFMRHGQETEPGEFQKAMTKQQWFDEIQIYVESLDMEIS